MSKTLFIVPLCLFILSRALPVFADQYDDCLNECNQNLAPCIEQIRISAGNIQEEKDSIAACNKAKADCIQACMAAETQPQAPPKEQPQELPSEVQPPVDLNGDIKTYDHNEIKTFEFK